MPRLTTYIAVMSAKAARFGSRLFRAGSGTTLPGLVAEKIDPAVIAELSASLPDGVIIVTGTNGKTTTAKMLTEILSAAGKKVLTNESGSNLTRGVASTLVKASHGLGLRIDADVAVFEIDEATMATAVPRLQPSLVVLTNLFRDQLDRYGELETIAERWAAIAHRLARRRLVLNADDPLVADLGRGATATVLYFGVEDDARSALPALQHAVDAKHCRRCGAPYVYDAHYLGHLGRYHCPSCGATRPEPAIAARDIRLEGTAARVHARPRRGDAARCELAPARPLQRLQRARRGRARRARSGSPPSDRRRRSARSRRVRAGRARRASTARAGDPAREEPGRRERGRCARVALGARRARRARVSTTTSPTGATSAGSGTPTSRCSPERVRRVDVLRHARRRDGAAAEVRRRPARAPRGRGRPVEACRRAAQIGPDGAGSPSSRPTPR